MAFDPDFASVSLLAHFDGTHGSTSFTDSSGYAHTLTAVGDAQLSTTAPKFGTAAARFDGTGDRITIPTHASFGFGTGPWTIEVQCRRDAVAGNTLTVVELYTSSALRILCTLAADGGPTFFDGSTNIEDGSASISIDTYYNYAWDYDGTTLRAYVDGSTIWSRTYSRDHGATMQATIGATQAGANAKACYIDEVRITKGVARYAGTHVTQTEAFPDSAGPTAIDARVSAPGPLGSPAALAAFEAQARSAVASPLGAPSVLASIFVATRASAASPLGVDGARAWALHDFTAALVDSPERCTADLITPDGPVRVPISSWQATVQTGFKDYGQCVVPACQPYLDAIDDATELVIYRRGLLADGRYLDACVVRVPLQTASFAQGPRRFTATLNGYAEAYTLSGIPPFSGRTLPGVQAVFTSAAGRRARGQLDWLIRPGHVVQVQGSPLTVAYINFTAGPNALFMDLGERSEA